MVEILSYTHSMLEKPRRTIWIIFKKHAIMQLAVAWA